MLSKSLIRLITSLQHKKFRKQYGLFCVEGIKSISEFIESHYIVETIYATPRAVAKLNKIPQNIKLVSVSDEEFKKLTSLNNPQGALALVKIPESDPPHLNDFLGTHTLVLDDIQDPGNLGTIIRTAEWFGFERIICSLDTVDVYNAKVVQATMGSLSRMRVDYLDISALLDQISVPSFGALLNGQSIFETNFGKEGLVVLGNEGNGIRPEIIEKLDYSVTIPSFGKAESLNVAVAATVFCTEIARGRKTNI